MIDTDIQPPGRLERLLPMLPMGRAGSADEVAEAILFLLSDAASYVNGANLRVSGAQIGNIVLRMISSENRALLFGIIRLCSASRCL